MTENEIILGDAYSLIKTLPDKSVDLIVTDPPYEFAHIDFGSTTENKWYSRRYADEISEDNLKSGIDLEILDDFVRVLKKINVYIFCNKEQIYDYMTYFVKERGCNFEFLIWAKTNPSPFANNHYLKDKEYCLYFWEKGVRLNTTAERGKTVFLTNVNKADKERYGHPTIKPEAIIESLILNSSERGGLILDPFCGSGTVPAVAKKLGRRYIGFELVEKWHKVATDRLMGITAKERKANIQQLKLF